jgi:transcriptional regulator with XRE-family HTH domain
MSGSGRATSAQVKEIASRVRELREIAGVSAASLARELGIEAQTYGEWEAGAADIPVGALLEIAGRFGVDLAELLTGSAPRLKTYCLIRAGQGPEVPRRSAYKYRSLAHNFIDKRVEPFLVEVDAASEHKPLSFAAHPGQEFNYVVEGRLLISVAGHEVELAAGDSLYYDSNQSHGMKALGGKPARFLAVII